MQIGSSMRLKHVYSGTCLANIKFMKKIENILSISRSDQAKYRVKVVEFHKTYGTATTIEDVTSLSLFKRNLSISLESADDPFANCNDNGMHH